ncbi:MAG: transposase, partial [Deltaproteobacteria bacterium]
WNILVQDESIFVYDYILKKWISSDKRPLVTVTGSRKKTIVFGSLSIDGNKQLFLQYDKFNSSTFIYYLKQIKKRFVGKCIIFVDRATPHCSKITKRFLAKNKDTIRPRYLPVTRFC